MRNSLNDTPNLVQSASQENNSPFFPSLIKNPLNSRSDEFVDSDNPNVETEVHQLFSKHPYQPKFLGAVPSKKDSSISSKFNSNEDSLSEPENLKTSNSDLDNQKKRNPSSFYSGSDGNSAKFKTATFTDVLVDARATADWTNSKTLKLMTKRVSTDQEIRSPSFNNAIGANFFGDGATKSLFQNLGSPPNSGAKILFFKQDVKDEISIKGESTESVGTREKPKPINIPPLRPQVIINSGPQSSHRKKVGWNANNLITRAKIRAAFAQAIGNNIFNATTAELRLIKDKSYVMSQEAKREPRKSTGRKKLPKVKEILEKHGIIREDIKKSEMQKILREIGKSRTLRESMIRRYLVLRKYLENNSILIQVKKVIVMTIIDPYSYFRIGWDIASLLLIFYDLMLIPFQMGFNLTISGFFLSFELFEDVFFIIDIILNFRTGFYHNGVLVRKNRVIMMHYLKRWFALDVVAIITSTLFLDIFFDDDELNQSNSFRLLRFVRFIRFMRVLRALRLKKLFQKVDDMFYSNFYNTIKSLVTLLFYIALVAHLSACLWYFVADTFGEYFGDSWIYHGGYADMSVMARYTVSLFWAVTTMLTVGYGDITPMNTLERAVNIVLMLVGCGVFAYSMNKIGMLVQSLNAQASETRQMYYNVIQYMDKMNVSKGLRGKVTQYLDYMKQNQKYSRFGGEQVFSILSENLRDEIRKDINGQVLREDEILLKNFGSKFLSILSYKLEERTFPPNEIIFDEIDKSCSLYFVTTGTVEIYLRSCDTVISQLDGGHHFGELSFFTGRSRTAAARSSSFAHILFITRDSFLSLVQDFPLEEETYHFIKDQMSIYNNYSMISVQCTVCGQNTHDARGCPRVHYVPDRQNILKTYQKTITDFMKNFKRKTRKKFRVLKDNPTIVIQAKTWCNNHPKEVKKLGSHSSIRQQKLSNISAVSPRHPMRNEILAELHRRRNLIRPINKIMVAKKFSGSPDELSPQLPPDSIFKKSSYSKQPAPRPTKKSSDPAKIPSRNSMSEEEEEQRTNNSILPTRMQPVSRTQQQEAQGGQGGQGGHLLSERNSFLGFGKLPMCPIRFDSNQPVSSRTGLDEDNFARAIEESLLNYELQQRLDEYQRHQALQMAFEREVVFDMVCNYKVYFPHNNISTLLEELRIKQNEQKARSKILDEEKKKAQSMNIRKINSLKTMTTQKKKPSSVSSLSFAAFKILKSEKTLQVNRHNSDADSEGSVKRYSSPKRPEIKTAFDKKRLQPQTTLGRAMGSDYYSSVMD